MQLNLRVTSNSAALPVQVCAVTESWTEGNGNGGAGDTSGSPGTTAATWLPLAHRGRLVRGQPLRGRHAPGTGAASVDITPIWQAWNTNAIANHGVLVRATADGTATIGSAEAGAASRPSIAIDSVGAPTP